MFKGNVVSCRQLLGNGVMAAAARVVDTGDPQACINILDTLLSILDVCCVRLYCTC